MIAKPGSRWKSAVCDAEVIVVRPAAGDIELTCGGLAMLAPGETAPEGATLDPDLAAGVHTGKRYSDPETGIELLGAKAGQGTLAVNGRPLSLKEAKALPASD